MKNTKVIYDYLNRLVWIQGQKKAGKGDKFYGRDAKRFQSDVKARAYARSLAKKRGESGFYDKGYGKIVPLRKKKMVRRSRDYDFGGSIF